MWLENLNAIKKASGKTLKQISFESGVPLGTLNKLFAGQTKDPKLDTVCAVVHALGYTLNDIDPGAKKAPLYSSEALKLAQDYDSLNEFGKKTVRAVVDVVKAQCEELSAAHRPTILAAARSGGVTEIEEITPDEVADGENVP